MSVEEDDDISPCHDAADEEGELEALTDGSREPTDEDASGSGSGITGEGADAFAEDDPPVATGVCRSGRYTAEDVVDESFECLELMPFAVVEVQECWSKFLKDADTQEAAGEALYTAIFDAAPSLQSLFKTPRAVMAMRFLVGLQQIMQALDDPEGLKVVVETLGFQHLEFEVTPPRVCVFRDAICEFLSLELCSRYTLVADESFRVVLNYIGGAFIYLRKNFAGRIRVLLKSWALANGEDLDADGVEVGAKAGKLTAEVPSADQDSKTTPKHDSATGSRGISRNPKGNKERMLVPTMFPDMFRFNAAVMGLGASSWFAEVLHSFDAIVRNVSNTYRLQEECDVLSLRLAKCVCSIELSEYKAVMMASLRSLIAKAWDSDHEVAWSWLWDNVERLLKSMLGKPAKQEKALAKLWGGLDDSSFAFVRAEVYARFFQAAPGGMNYFRQSVTRLHFISDKVSAMSLQIYKEPEVMVDELSALGLRHVGYGIPTDLFTPFVASYVEVVSELADDSLAQESFRWSLHLISRILLRVINEGSTIVMRAINDNSGKQLRRAVSCAPRNKRADWLLKVTVGTESISPFKWAIKAGSFEAAEAILRDLLTIRADRDRYYFGIDDLFARHPRIVRDLGLDAPALLPVLLDGLMWRSRTTEDGQRRVIYFVKHLVLDADGSFSKAIEWITDLKDPTIVCHPVVCLITDVVWNRVAYGLFLYGKLWFLLTLLVFVLAQSVLFRVGVDDGGERNPPFGTRLAILLCRCFVYGCNLPSLVCCNVKHVMVDYRRGATVHVGRLAIPSFLFEAQALLRFLLMLVLFLMFCFEPILSCMSVDSESDDQLFSEFCPAGQRLFKVYSVFAAIGTMLYYLLLCDLAVFSTRVSAFVLVLARTLSELALSLMALVFIILCFASAGCALREDFAPFKTVPGAGMFLLRIFLGMLGDGNYEELTAHPLLMAVVVAFMVTTVVFLLNLLVAQMGSAYAATFQDMLGYARINRGVIVAEVMRSVGKARWRSFVESLELDRSCEFGEGDTGFPGAITTMEPAAAHPTTTDAIRRFGGSTSPSAVWPEEEEVSSAAADRFEKVEGLIKRVMKKLDASGRPQRQGGSGNGSGGASSCMTSGLASVAERPED